MISVVMLSGGMDSVATLVKLLKETDDEIMVHHIKLVNNENRHHAEALAVRKIVPYLRKIRRFRFSTSTVQIPGCDEGYVGYDIMTVHFMAGHIVRSIHNQAGYTPPIRMVHGYTKTDGVWTESPRHVSSVRIFEEHFHDYKDHGLPTPTVEFLLQDMTAKEAYDKYIDEELDKMIISCRKPKLFYDDTYIECGFCHTCNKMNDIRGIRNESNLY
jgi:hypothetical protein